jgi:hypothetical protein
MYSSAKVDGIPCLRSGRGFEGASGSDGASFSTGSFGPVNSGCEESTGSFESTELVGGGRCRLDLKSKGVDDMSRDCCDDIIDCGLYAGWTLCGKLDGLMEMGLVRDAALIKVRRRRTCVESMITRRKKEIT